ncbi:MAG: TonB-dependent receptor [Marinobacter sp.]|nr:TonB-dependent receptor [Marinobacter sp.]
MVYHNYKQSRLITRAHDPEQGPDANGLAQRYVGGRLFKGDSVSASVDISGVVRAGTWRHDWLTGVGYGTSTNESTSGDLHNQSISDGSGPYPVDPIDINSPVYSDYPYADQLWNADFTRKTERVDKNLYLQDMVHLPNGRTRLMLSGGWSQFETDTEKDPATKLQRWSPRMAIMHDVTDTATVYASYGESFTPQSSPTYLTTDGRYITDPVEGLQYEVGFKQDLFDANAMFTAAVFSLDKKNVATVIENLECTYGGTAQPSATPEDACYELAGLTRAQGVELRLSGQLMDGWVAQVGYSFTDTKYVDTDNEFAEGRSVKYTPRHSLALWNKFRVHRSASLGEFNLGLGMRAWSETHDSWTDTGTNWNPGYGLVDLGVFWDKDLSASKRLKVSLNISNLFDKQYFDRARFPPNNILYGDERRAALSVQLSL